MGSYPEIRRTSRGARIDVQGSHPNLEFNLVISGRGTCFLEGRQHELLPGTLLWIAPGEYHQLLRSPDFEMWLAILDPTHFAPHMLADVVANPCRLLASEDALALDRLLSHLSQDSDQPEVYLAGADYLFRSAWHATMSSPGPTRKALHPAVKQALDILRSSTTTPSSADLARLCGVTHGYLSQLLNEQTGRGFIEWRNCIRIERFVLAYPKSGDLLTAALDAGFGSYTQFHRVFCDMLGSTPGEWARSGSHLNLGAISSAGTDNRGAAVEGQRMIWYPLSELVLPPVSRWFRPGLQAVLCAPEAVDANAAPIESWVADWADLRLSEEALVMSVSEGFPEQAGKLRDAFRRLDVFAQYRATLWHFGTGLADLAELATIYVGVAWYCVSMAPPPSQAEVAALAHRMRNAMHRTGCFRNAGDTDRMLAAAGLIASASILRNAMEAARASGSEKTLARISAAARASCLGTTGIDVEAIDLFELVR